MHIGDSPEEAAYRQTATTWLGGHATLKDAAPASDGNADPDLATHIQRCRTWQRTLYDGGWAGITWPKAFGGQGGSPIESAIFAEEQARYDVSVGAFAVAIGMVGPTLIAHGTDQQRERFLDPMLRGDHVWCQLFSEPGAGSDLASLATRAEPRRRPGAGSSPARRCGPRSPSSASSASCSRGPTLTSPSARASRTSSST